MTEVTALNVYFIQVKDNFIHLHSKLLQKFKTSKNDTICVEIKLNDVKKFGSCYSTPFNYNGENAFNISSSYAETLGIRESDTVIVSNAAYVKSLKTVHATPISIDDWHIMESSAEVVQSSLLNQIRIIYIHQILSIWISKSFSLKMHIDHLDNELTCGKLEQYTEVVVSTHIKKCDNCELNKIEYGNKNENKINVSFRNTWNFFQDLFSFSDKVKSNLQNEKSYHSLELFTIGIFRCIPYNNFILNFPPKLCNFPYNAFVGRNFLKYFPNVIHDDAYILCRLTHISSISYKGENNHINEENAENGSVLTKQPDQEMYIHLYVIDDTDVVDNVTYSLLNIYPSIFVSKAIQLSFSLKTNSKVKLDIVEGGESEEKLTEINFSILKSDNNIVEEDVDKEMKDYFCSYIKLYKKLIVNNYSVFTFNNSANDVLYLTFNPMNVFFTELCLEDVNNCNFRFVKKDVNINLNTIDEKLLNSDLIELSFFQEIVQKLKMSLLLKLKIQLPFIKSYVENHNYIVVQGDTGSGKTTIINMLHDDLLKSSIGVFLKKLECKTLKGKLVPKLKKIFEAALVECLCYQPAILCLDDLDSLFTFSKQNNQEQSDLAISSYSNRLSNTISDLIRSYSKYHITVVATAVNVFNFESNMFKARGAALFSNSLRIPVLNEEMRHESFIQFLRKKFNLSISDHIFKNEYLQHIVECTEGYCIQDMSDLVDRIYFEMLKRQVTNDILEVFQVQREDIDKSVSTIIPLSLKGINFHKNSNITWKDVGGLENAKQQLMEVLIWPSKYPKIFEQCPLKLQSGVLLYGVPGCGKTLLASAVAGESGLNFISIKGPELLSKFVGGSEEGIRNTFQKARNAKPCILFFDEFDSLAPRRGDDVTGVTDRVVNQLLTELDGVESVNGVWVLAATSRPDLIDLALLRHGRLGTMIYCTLPTQVERLSILKILSSSMNLADDVNLNSVAKITDGYTGADLKAVLYTAYINNNNKTKYSSTNSGSVLHEQIQHLNLSSQNLNEINTECLINAALQTKPSLNLEMRLAFEKIYEQFSKKKGSVVIDVTNQRLTYA